MKNASRGFTFFEIMIVTGVIAMLSTTFVLAIGPMLRRSRQAKERTQLRQIAIAIGRLSVDTGLVPGQLPATPCYNNVETLLNSCSSGLISRCSTSDFPGWKGPYLTQSFQTDQWGTAYEFDPDYNCRPDVAGCENVEYTSSDSFGRYKLIRAVVSYGPNKLNNYCLQTGSSCVRADQDNIVYVMCEY